MSKLKLAAVVVTVVLAVLVGPLLLHVTVV